VNANLKNNNNRIVIGCKQKYAVAFLHQFINSAYKTNL